MAFDVTELLKFDKMVTPVVIKVVYWIGIVGCVLFGLFSIVMALSQGQIIGALGGLFIIVIGPLIVRVYCELLMVAFKIHDYLRDIRDARR